MSWKKEDCIHRLWYTAEIHSLKMEGPEEISGEDHIFNEATIIPPLHYD